MTLLLRDPGFLGRVVHAGKAGLAHPLPPGPGVDPHQTGRPDRASLPVARNAAGYSTHRSFVETLRMDGHHCWSAGGGR